MNVKWNKSLAKNIALRP